MHNKLEELEEKLAYKFNNINLLVTALTHKSYAYENAKEAKTEYNERLEFLGDAILEHTISDLLFKDKNKFKEGEMSKMRASIVCENSLSRALKDIKAEKYLRLGKCEKMTGGRNKDAIIADAFESIMGAIYIDGGYEVASRTILKLLQKEIVEVLEGKNLNIDYKTKLQEELQKNGTVKIEYVLISESGPEHDKTFCLELLFNGKKIGDGNGKNKKQAEQRAAKNALERQSWC